ncbi:MAG: homoserine O-succinyltransferase [Alphaproteobacteria bacterium]|nr:homoserine O-succinyltransferase [Alphaproteobacteria bacterium]
MPIKIPDGLPARKTLEEEGVLLIKEERAILQDIRPMRIAIVNLMPEKIKTETQLARVLGSTPLQVEMTLISMASHTPKNTSAQHLLDFYRPLIEIQNQKFDGLIVTGAPIEQLPFEDVTYWEELREIFNWSLTNVHSNFHLCWGGQAALNHFYDIPKYQLPQKRFGIYTHRVLDHTSLLMRGLNDEIPVPVSRHTENRIEDFANFGHLQVLMDSEEAGMCMVLDHKLRHVHMFNHMEYDSTTIGDEYQRDVAKGDDVQLPANYYPDDDPSKVPINTWRGNGHLLFGNWLNYVYQSTHYDLEEIGTDREGI